MAVTVKNRPGGTRLVAKRRDAVVEQILRIAFGRGVKVRGGAAVVGPRLLDSSTVCSGKKVTTGPAARFNKALA